MEIPPIGKSKDEYIDEEGLMGDGPLNKDIKEIKTRKVKLQIL